MAYRRYFAGSLVCIHALEILLRLLTIKFGVLPVEFVQWLETVSDVTVLDSLSEQVLVAQSLDNLRPQPPTSPGNQE